jgi:hypothetical protein
MDKVQNLIKPLITLPHAGVFLLLSRMRAISRQKKLARGHGNKNRQGRMEKAVTLSGLCQDSGSCPS